jgi:hypothetical protein
MTRDWYDPARLFADGYPQGITSALRAVPQLAGEIRDEVAALHPGLALEVGPGDEPIIGDWPGIYVDITPRFLLAHAGRAARGDVVALPFADRAFDVAVAADVLTHVRPDRRTTAIAELARVARSVILFNPEPGTAFVDDSGVPTEPLVATLELAGLRTRVRRFQAWLPWFSGFVKNGEYVMTLTVATRPAP